MSFSLPSSMVFAPRLHGEKTSEVCDENSEMERTFLWPCFFIASSRQLDTQILFLTTLKN